jgi:SAM-dependent MidA family methyltransferase
MASGSQINPALQPLADRLRARVEQEGPIPFYEWMKAVLYDEREGYYCRRDRIRQGRAGDYRTAPETSPLFAAVFANYFMKTYFDLQTPPEWTIVEVGGGAGDFAHGVLSTLQERFPKVYAATRYVIDEISDSARSQILMKVAEFKAQVQFRSLSEITEPFPCAIVFSNELLDAFPVHRLIGRAGMLRELFVGLNEPDGFVWVENDLSEGVSAYCEREQLQLAEGQIYEVNLDAERFVSQAANLIGEGLLITVDYGATRAELINDPTRFTGTLRTFHRHRIGEDVFSHPGAQDLTTTVDWTEIMEAGARSGLETLRLEPLHNFLLVEGALEELSSAGTRIFDSAELFKFNAGARELILPNSLGGAFQVLVQRKVA